MENAALCWRYDGEHRQYSPNEKPLGKHIHCIFFRQWVPFRWALTVVCMRLLRYVENTWHLTAISLYTGQFSMPSDKRQLYEFDVRVPLMIRGPNVTAGRVVKVLLYCRFILNSTMTNPHVVNEASVNFNFRVLSWVFFKLIDFFSITYERTVLRVHECWKNYLLSFLKIFKAKDH